MTVEMFLVLGFWCVILLWWIRLGAPPPPPTRADSADFCTQPAMQREKPIGSSSPPSETGSTEWKKPLPPSPRRRARSPRAPLSTSGRSLSGIRRRVLPAFADDDEGGKRGNSCSVETHHQRALPFVNADESVISGDDSRFLIPPDPLLWPHLTPRRGALTQEMSASAASARRLGHICEELAASSDSAARSAAVAKCLEAVGGRDRRCIDVNRPIISNGYSLFHFACLSGSAYLVERLLTEHAAEINAADLDHNSPLYLAVYAATKASPTEDLSVVEVLLRRGAAKVINRGNFSGLTPLHQAAKAGSRQLVRLLLRHGADAGARASRRYGGALPVDIAATRRRFGVAALLEAALAERGGRGAAPPTVLSAADAKQLLETPRRLRNAAAAAAGATPTTEELVVTDADHRLQDNLARTKLDYNEE